MAMKGSCKQPAIRRFGKRLGERSRRKKLSPYSRPDLKRAIELDTPLNGGSKISVPYIGE
jgi:hypothetical protein